MCFRIFFVVNRVRVSNPQGLTYTKILVKYPPGNLPLALSPCYAIFCTFFEPHCGVLYEFAWSWGLQLSPKRSQLPNNLGKSIAQECKKSTSCWRASIQNDWAQVRLYIAHYFFYLKFIIYSTGFQSLSHFLVEAFLNGKNGLKW